MIRPEDSAVLMAISEAGAGVSGWPVMLGAVARYLNADTAELRIEGQGWTQHGPIDAPMPQVFVGLRLGRVYTGEELLARARGPDDLTRAADHRAIGVQHADGVAWLVLTRNRTLFRAADSAALAALAPHLAQAMALAARLEGLQRSASAAERTLRHAGIGALCWDARGRAVAQDAVARELLGQVSYRALPAEGAILRDVAPGVEMVVQLDADGRRVGYLRVCPRPLPAPEVLATALGLGLAEARLARALGHGDSLLEAAERLGLSLETARFYSKQIYAKTGLRGQPDLMRRLWTSALALAAPPAAGT